MFDFLLILCFLQFD